MKKEYSLFYVYPQSLLGVAYFQASLAELANCKVFVS